jgi:hypothetical protein
MPEPPATEEDAADAIAAFIVECLNDPIVRFELQCRCALRRYQDRSASDTRPRR